jgi:hypothetical protein
LLLLLLFLQHFEIQTEKKLRIGQTTEKRPPPPPPPMMMMMMMGARFVL